MKYQTLLQEKITSQFNPVYFEIANESPAHGLQASAEKHFRVVVVSEAFTGASRVDRHRMVHECVAVELREHVHALSVQTFTPAEWTARAGSTHASPECLGGGKRHGMK